MSMYSFVSEQQYKNVQTFIGQEEIPSDKGSLQFNTSSSSYLTLNQQSAFDFGANNFTMECWFYMSAAATVNRGLIDLKTSTSSGQWAWFIGSSAGLAFYFHDNPSPSTSEVRIESTVVPDANKWYHAAVVRNGNTILQFLNGIPINQPSTATFTGTMYTRGTPLLRVGVAGVIGGGATFFEGLITSPRIVRGVALYTDQFVPPMPQDITNISGTSLLLGVNTRETFLNDSSNNAYTMTNNSNVRYGSAKPNISLNDWRIWSKPSGTKMVSITCIGAGGGGGSSANAAYNVNKAGGAGGSSGAISTVTIPAKFLPDTLYVQPGSGGVGGTGNGAHGGVGGSSIVSLAPIIDTEVSDSSSVKIYNGPYINFADGGRGGLGAIATTAGSIIAAPVAAVVNSAPFAKMGLYNFIPAANGSAGTAGGSVPGDVVVMGGNTVVTGGAGGNGSQTIEIRGGIVTPFQSNGITSASYFPTANTINSNYLSNTGYSSSSFNTGASQHVLSALSANLSLGTGSYTLEFWWENGNQTTRQDIVYFMANTSVSNNRIGVYHNSGALLFSAGDTSAHSTRITYTAAGTLFERKWSHIAVCRSGSNTRMFVDGTQQGSTFTSDTLNLSSPLRAVIGRDGTAGATYLTGLVSNLRLIKGEALYTSNFTPPTSPLTRTGNTVFLLVNHPGLVDSSSDAITLTNFSSIAANGNPFDTNIGIAHGLSLAKPQIFTGGAGGSSRAGGPGMDGGAGQIGSGGGGAGTGTAFGAKGGSGGPGLITIRSW